MPDDTDATSLLNQLAAGGQGAADRLLELIYGELRRLAESRLRQERSDHTLQATALVHEAYLRLVGQTRVVWKSRAHFFAVAAQAMRRILIDHARSRARQKRGAAGRALPLDEGLTISPQTPATDLLALDEAMTRLAQAHPRKAQVVEMRFFGGLTAEEIAAVQDVTVRTVERDWEFARAWFYREMEGADGTATES